MRDLWRVCANLEEFERVSRSFEECVRVWEDTLKLRISWESLIEYGIVPEIITESKMVWHLADL